MSARWEEKLRRFQQSLDALARMVRVELRYSVVHLHGPPIAFDDRARPRLYSSSGPIAKVVTVPISPEEHQVHLLFGDNHAEIDDEVLLALESQLGELHGILHLVPQRVLPPSDLPPLPNRGDENLVRWGLALSWLGATEQKVFHDEVEYSESASQFANDGQVCEWERFSPMPDFDPVEFVTRTGKARHTWAYWSREHKKAGRPFPEVLAVSLTKPLFYASLNAVDLMIQSGLGQRPLEKAKRGVTRPLRDGSTLEDIEHLVLSELLRHHRRADGACFDPLVQTEISVRVGRSQPTVSRALGKLLNRVSYRPLLTASDRYLQLCREKLIVGILEQIEVPRTEREWTNASLEQVAGADSPDLDDQ